MWLPFLFLILWCKNYLLNGKISPKSKSFFKQDVCSVIDEDGFRHNVGIILANDQNKLFWGRRVGQDAWQFPQGGVNENEAVEDTLYRELHEEVGLERKDVEIIASTNDWLSYRLPPRLVRSDRPLCVGQKQKWYLLRLVSSENAIQLDKTAKPEFDGWAWVSYWFPLHQVVAFKREVYRQALCEFSEILLGSKKNIQYDPL